MSPASNLTPAQIRGARAMLGITALELAEAARIGVATLRRIETAPGESGHRGVVDQALRHALDRLGIALVDAEEGFAPGIRLRA